MIRSVFVGATLLAVAGSTLAQSPLPWLSYGQNAQHEAQCGWPSQALSKIHWHEGMDDDPAYYVTAVLAHYASPMVSAGNTVVYSRRRTTTVNGSTDYNNWNLIGVSGSNAATVFNLSTDYQAPEVYSSSNGQWTTMVPTTLAILNSGTNLQSTAAVVAGAGGSIFVRSTVDSPTATTKRLVFYTTLQDYNKNVSTYAPIVINSGISADNQGNVYFGYEVTGTVAASLNLGTGGVAKVNLLTGASTYLSVQSLGVNSAITRPTMNAAPAITADGLAAYYALTQGEGGVGVLAKLTTKNMKLLNQVVLMDPSINGEGALLIDESSASPMIGPDGHVFMGVFGNQWRESHGWLLQFDQNLNPGAPNGKLWPAGAFGWDDTPSIVPASIVPSYKGTSPYLLLCKYNNYDDEASDPGADGSNMVAVIDPTSNSATHDRQSGIAVMNEVISVLGPTKTNDDSSHPNARREWCINSAVIDIPKKSAIINSEDGHAYRWSFVSNSITEAINLAPATSEAYTSTAIGPDGQIYAMNNTLLFAIGN